MVVDLDLARKFKEAKTNHDISVEDLLKKALEDVQNGVYANPIKCLICVVNETDGDIILEKYRCGVARIEEIGYLSTWKMQSFERLGDE